MFQMKQLAQNLKQLRTARGMTQTELADALQISPQSVSKWECAMTVPSIENLCLIAQLLQVLVDRLLSCSDRGKVMIGIDGGGSKVDDAAAQELLARADWNIRRAIALHEE